MGCIDLGESRALRRGAVADEVQHVACARTVAFAFCPPCLASATLSQGIVWQEARVIALEYLLLALER